MSAANQLPPDNPKDQNSTAVTPNMMQRLSGRKSWVRGLAVLGLVGIYAAARPTINERLGLDLPALKVDSRGQVVSAKSESSNGTSTLKQPAPSQQPTSPPIASPVVTNTAKATDATRSPAEKKSSSTTSTIKSTPTKDAGPLANRMRTEPDTKSSTKSPTTNNKSTSNKPSAPPTEKADPSLQYGLLRDTGGKRYVSPAGLLYTPGSAEGHRIEHVRRHTEDDPGRPGSHGVFDGGIEGALKTIDNAYALAKQGTRTTKQEEDGRIVYTVDMGKRIGFVGGRDGGRKNKPMARRVTLVLEGTRVITAYPK